MSKTLDPGVVVPGAALSLRGGAVAATALAAALLVGVGLGPAVETGAASPPGTVAAPAPGAIEPDVAQRLVGVARDLAEAVTHGEITAEQAERFLVRLHHRLAP